MQTKEFTEAQMDFQWNTMKKNFDATWKGRSEWYRKGDAPVLDLETPSDVRADTQIAPLYHASPSLCVVWP